MGLGHLLPQHQTSADQIPLRLFSLLGMPTPLALSGKRIERRSRLQRASIRPPLAVYSALAEFCPARLNRHGTL